VDVAAFFEMEFAEHHDGARATHAVLTSTFGHPSSQLDRVS
jgi:hypothetical protein